MKASRYLPISEAITKRSCRGLLRLPSRELDRATFLSHGRKAEVNISHARRVVSQIFKLIVSTNEKIP